VMDGIGSRPVGVARSIEETDVLKDDLKKKRSVRGVHCGILCFEREMDAGRSVEPVYRKPEPKDQSWV
jgi:hypothetical protein